MRACVCVANCPIFTIFSCEFDTSMQFMVNLSFILHTHTQTIKKRFNNAIGHRLVSVDMSLWLISICMHGFKATILVSCTDFFLSLPQPNRTATILHIEQTISLVSSSVYLIEIE